MYLYIFYTFLNKIFFCPYKVTFYRGDVFLIYFYF